MPSVQPGGRAPAPGKLALVQAFINTHYDLEIEHGAELLATPRSAEQWFREHGLIAPGEQVSTAGQQRALATREALRELARAGSVAARRALDELAAGAAVEVRFDTDAPTFVPATGSGIAGALGLILARVGLAIADGTWARLKVCPGEDCGWAFYDHSRNQTGRWCSMAVCGGRAKARTHYRRRRGG